MLSIKNTNRLGTQGFAETSQPVSPRDLYVHGQPIVGNANMLRAELSSNPLRM